MLSDVFFSDAMTADGVYFWQVRAVDRAGHESPAGNAVVTSCYRPRSGDVNNDDRIDISEVIAGLRMALGVDAFDPAADVNENGRVDLADLLLILQAVTGVRS